MNMPVKALQEKSDGTADQHAYENQHRLEATDPETASRSCVEPNQHAQRDTMTSASAAPQTCAAARAPRAFLAHERVGELIGLFGR